MPYFAYVEIDWPLVFLAVGSLIATIPLFFILDRYRPGMILLANTIVLSPVLLMALGNSLHWPMGEYVPEPEIQPAPRLTASLRPLFPVQSRPAWLVLKLPPGIESPRQMPGGGRLDCALRMESAGTSALEPWLGPERPRIKWRIESRDSGRSSGKLACSSRGKLPFLLRGVTSFAAIEFRFWPAWLFYVAYMLPLLFLVFSLWLICMRLRRTAHLQSRSEYREAQKQKDSKAKSAEVRT